MPDRGLIPKKLWGRSLGGVLAAVGVMLLASYLWYETIITLALLGMEARQRRWSQFAGFNGTFPMIGNRPSRISSEKSVTVEFVYSI